jgi:2-methylcitrate dehydratase PrpD
MARLTGRDTDIRSFIEEIARTELSPDLMAKARWCLIDLVATAVAGSQTPLAGILNDYVHDFHAARVPDGPACRPITGGSVTNPVGAALAGGMIIDSVDSHDGHSLTKGHVGCAVLPTLLAVTEATRPDCEGSLLLRLLVAGYEIGTRAGIALHRSAAEYHSSGAWNALTCAALTGHLLGLDTERFRHALGIAEYHGPRSQLMRDVDYPTMVKDGSGWGAMAGVSAAYLAAAGFSGAPALSIVSAELDEVWSDLGEHWRIFEQYTKPYPVCRWAHPGIDGVRELQARHEIRIDDVENVIVHTFHEATRLFQGVPRTTDEAQYGTSFPTAVALAHGDVLPEHIADRALGNPVVQRLTERVRYVEDVEYSKAFPARRFARVEIRMRDGSSFSSAPREPRGNPECPLSEAELQRKFLLYVSPSWGEQRSRACFEFLSKFGENGATVADLLASIRTDPVAARAASASGVTPARYGSGTAAARGSA